MATTKPKPDLTITDAPCWKNKNIHERLVAIRKELAPVEHDLDVGTGRGSYKGIGHRQVTGMVRKLLDKWNISLWWSYEPVFPGAPVTQIYDSSKTVNNQSKETRSEDVTLTKVTALSTVRAVATFACADNPGDLVVAATFGEGKDAGDKAVGKAMTYAKKYMFLNVFLADYADNTEDNETARTGNPEDAGDDF